MLLYIFSPLFLLALFPCTKMEIFAVLCVLFCVTSVAWAATYSVINYGAVGDGIADDSQAFLKAWAAACKDNTAAGSTLSIPPKNFLLNPVTFSGPCKPSNIIVEISGTILAPDKIPAANAMYKKWLMFTDVSGLVVNGTGKIDGQGQIWWQKNCRTGTGCTPGPTQLSFAGCNGLRMSDVKLVNSQRNHLSISDCSDVLISGLTITAPGDSPNTDGIDISSSRNIQVQSSTIATGDDCIAINGGTLNITITQVTCGPGHGISIGSLGQDNAHETVEQVYVGQSILSGTTNGARIKTWQGGSGYAKDITFEDITLDSVNNPIIIDQYYCENSHSCRNQTEAVHVSNVKYKNIQGTTTSNLAIIINCSTSVACTDIVMDNVQITSVNPHKKLTSSCINAKGTRSPECVPTVSCLAS